MTWLRCLLAVVVVLGAVAGPSGAAAPRLDDLMLDLNLTPIEAPAPPLNVVTLDGARVSLAEIRNQPVLVYFWATW